MSRTPSNRKSHPLAARIKRLMQKDDEVGRIASVTPILISTYDRHDAVDGNVPGRALELFLRRLCTNVMSYAKNKKSRTISPSHLKAYIYSDSTMDFLKSTVKDVPDLAMGESPCPGHPPPAKRTRTLPTESQTVSRPKGRGKADWCPGMTPKRQCVPSSAPDLHLAEAPAMLFGTGGQEEPAVAVNAVWKATSAALQPEMVPLNLLEKQTGVIAVPVGTTELHLDSAMRNVLLQIPVETRSGGTAVAMPPVSLALSITDVELGMRPKEGDTPLAVHDLDPTKPFVQNMQPAGLKAEEDNYDFSEDEMEVMGQVKD